ncbi:MAG TPA: hypothetical protein VFX50_02850, partial [Gemmatimonadales bacterium]|nr:hypothetical protein [Gemmatimonadales bacterium]
PQRIFLLSMLGAIALLGRVPRRTPWRVLLPVLAMIAFSLQSQRNIGLFAAVALPLLALEFAPELRAALGGSRWGAALARSATLGRSAPWLAGGALVAMALAASGGRVGPVQLVEGAFSPSRFPVRAVERARAAGLTGTLLHEFTWGGYVLHAWPEQKVFIDGGTDFYGVPLMKEYVQLWNLEPGWRERIVDRGFTLALLPARSSLAEELRRQPGWSTWFSDSTAVLLRRTP